MMSLDQQNKILKIIIADDDPDDRHLAGLAFKEAELNHKLDFALNGQELMDNLKSISTSGNLDQLPDLILLDLNMPKKDGRVALKEIKSDPILERINIIIFSTSISAEDNAYVTKLGVIQCLTKPCGFFDLVEIMKNICRTVVDKI